MSGVAYFSWTDQNVTRAKTLWLDGKSALEIAVELGATRNAVIGKMNRMGLFKKGRDQSEPGVPGDAVDALAPPMTERLPKAPAKPRILPAMSVSADDVHDARKNVISHKPLAPTLIEPVPAPAAGEGMPFLEAAGRVGICKYPLWSYDDQPIDEKQVCGKKPQIAGTAWCSHHRKRVFDLNRRPAPMKMPVQR